MLSRMLKINSVFWLYFLFYVPVYADQQRSLELVTASDSIELSISNTQTRSLFLGAPIFINGIELVPFRNNSDPLIEDVFLQNIVFMSKRTYERRLLTNIFRYGGNQIRAFTDVGLLVDALTQTKGSVGYIWSEQLSNYPQLKSLGVIWKQ